jgi:hypothetical protein
MCATANCMKENAKDGENSTNVRQPLCSTTGVWAASAFVRKLMDQSSDQHGNQNWAAENRRRIARRRGKRPATKAAQIWALWPDIRSQSRKANESK